LYSAAQRRNLLLWLLLYVQRLSCASQGVRRTKSKRKGETIAAAPKAVGKDVVLVIDA
jgi:hypothetical protein